MARLGELGRSPSRRAAGGVSWNESPADLAVAQYDRDLAEAFPPALLLMGVKALFIGRHQQLCSPQMMSSRSVTVLKYFKSAAEHR